MRNFNRIDRSMAPEKWSEELDQIIQDVQIETLRFTIFGLLTGALIALLGFIYYSELSWTIILALGLVLLAAIVWGIHQKSFLLAAWILVLGVTAVIVAFWIKSEAGSAIFLLIIPVGLSSLIVTRLTGFFFALVLSLSLFIPTSALQVNEMDRSILLIMIWCVYAMIWITFRPLINTLRWSWKGYRTNQLLLEKNQEYQVQLLQSMENLKDANIQLTRLNTLAQNLRIVAEEERKIKEQFVATVSHELRTPLNMIIGFCEMITQNPKSYDRSLPPALLSDLKVVLRNSQHLSSLIDDVLDLSQIEAGQMKLSREMVSFKELIDAVTIAVRPLFESKKLYLRATIPDDLPLIFCDKKRIREVLLNLLSNAGRFTETGGVTIGVWQDEKYLYTSITDTGKGIDPKMQVNLFEPFQQLDVSIQQRYGGTGLGLAISKQFIELHDGKIWVESKEGEGTSFYFKFPILPPVFSDPGALRWFNPYIPYEERPPTTPAPAITVPPRLIVVERGKTISHLLGRHWENVDIETVDSMEGALLIHNSSPANMILVNTSLLGTEMVYQSFSEFASDIPIISLNVIGSESISDRLGVQNYLLKPISSDTLINAIKNLDGNVRRILLVDDEPDTLQLFSRILTAPNHGYQVFRALNGSQALEMMKNHCPDLVLLDLTMPVMDGFETLKVINQDPELCNVPVILMSARDPVQSPIASQFLMVTSPKGLSLRILMDCFAAISDVFSSHGLSAGLKQTGTRSDLLVS
jgi:signal transduction histidine kinase/CheY-like chemotaxis protein